VRRARIEGFISLDHFNRAVDAYAELGRWLAEGRPSTGSIPCTARPRRPGVNRPFEGTNTGKPIVL
jgi:NADPH-dependent curcumin reductase CurA